MNVQLILLALGPVFVFFIALEFAYLRKHNKTSAPLAGRPT